MDYRDSIAGSGTRAAILCLCSSLSFFIITMLLCYVCFVLNVYMFVYIIIFRFYPKGTRAAVVADLVGLEDGPRTARRVHREDGRWVRLQVWETDNYRVM